MHKHPIRTALGSTLERALALVPVAAFAATVAVGLFLASAGSATAGGIDIGRAGATVCAGCHGMDGIGVAPGFPNLAGQDALYLRSQLTAFREKTRTGGQSALMYGMAAGLSDEDIENLAAYFSSLAP